MKKIFTVLFSLALLSATLANTNHVAHFTDSTQGVHLNKTVLKHGIRTVDFWFSPEIDINPGSLIEFSALITRDSPTQNGEWGFFIDNTSGQLSFFRRIGTAQHEIKSDNTSWLTGHYYHVVGVIDSTSGMFLYIDNSLQTEGDSSYTAILNANDDTFIGKWGSLSIRHFKGKVDNIRMWSRALSPSEISSLTCDITGSHLDSLKLWLKMEALSPATTIAVDASANGNDCSVGGVLHGQPETICLPSNTEDQLTEIVSFDVYPNPSSGNFNVVLNLKQNYSLTLSDLLGNVIYARSFLNGSTNETIRVNNPGTYFLTISSDYKTITKKLVAH